MKYRYRDYAHDTYERSEMEDRLRELGWPEEVAAKFVANHKPLYEVGAEIEYDSDTNRFTVLRVMIDSKEFVPVDE